MGYYQPCPEFDECNRLIKEYYETGQYEMCFQGHLALAEKGYPLAECQIGYFYCEGLGVEKNAEKAFYWTKRAAEHGDRDGQFNLACFYEKGFGTPAVPAAAKEWYEKAARQRQTEAVEKCRAFETR